MNMKTIKNEVGQMCNPMGTFTQHAQDSGFNLQQKKRKMKKTKYSVNQKKHFEININAIIVHFNDE